MEPSSKRRRLDTDDDIKSYEPSPCFACPFYVAQPKLRPHHPCEGQEFHAISNVEEHLGHCHTASNSKDQQYPRIFDDNDFLPFTFTFVDDYQSTQRGPVHSKISQDILSQIKSRRVIPNSSERDVWFQIWDILFPDHSRPKSPYVNHRNKYDTIPDTKTPENIPFMGQETLGRPKNGCDPLTDQSNSPQLTFGTASSPTCTTWGSSTWDSLSSKSFGFQQDISKKTSSQETNPRQCSSGNIQACDSCLSEAGVEKFLACVFYKHNPEQHSACMHTKFRSISSLGQHIRNLHGPEHPLAMQLPPMPKNHQQTPNEKWLWVWYRLFPGHTPPNCPYSHPKEDLKAQILHQFFQELSQLHRENTDVGDLVKSLTQHICSSPKPLSKWQFMDLLRESICPGDSDRLPDPCPPEEKPTHESKSQPQFKTIPIAKWVDERPLTKSSPDFIGFNLDDIDFELFPASLENHET